MQKSTARAPKPSARATRGVARTDLVAAFTYFETPDYLGGDDSECSLLLDEASARLEAAWQCRTWGAFATLTGLTWATFVKQRRDEIAELFDENTLRASTPLVFGELWGQYAVVEGFPDPRASAYDFLRANIPPEVLQDSRLKSLIDLGGSAPGGNIDVVTSSSPAGFVTLQKVLYDAGFVGLTLEWSDGNPLGFLA